MKRLALAAALAGAIATLPAAAAESLKEQATRLNQVVGIFRVEASIA